MTTLAADWTDQRPLELEFCLCGYWYSFTNNVFFAFVSEMQLQSYMYNKALIQTGAISMLKYMYMWKTRPLQLRAK